MAKKKSEGFDATLLKEILIEEIDKRTMFADALETVLKISDLKAIEKELNLSIKVLGEVKANELAHADQTREDTAKIQADAAQRAITAKEEAESIVQVATKQATRIDKDAQDDLKAFQDKQRAVNKAIKELEVTTAQAKDAKVKAEKDLEDIRAKLRSI